MQDLIQTMPEAMGRLPVDRQNMRRCQLTGLYREQTPPIGGRPREFLTYLAPELEYDRNAVLVVPPSGCDPVRFLEESGLRALADEEKFFLHLLVPEAGGWALDGETAGAVQGMFAAVTSRQYYVTMVKQDNFYLLGFGDGADAALQAATRLPQPRQDAQGNTLPPVSEDSDLFSAVGLFGTLTGQGLAFLREEQCPLPVWLWDSPGQPGADRQALERLRRVNGCEETVYSGDGADQLWQPSPVRVRSEVNEERIAQVRFTAREHWTPDDVKQTLEFLFRHRRHVSFGHKNLRYYKDPDKMGAELRTLTVDGWGRRWYEYVPESVRRNGQPAPLVLTLHARGMDAAGFFDISGMSCVAEERGFICCFPESGVYQPKPDGLATVPLWEGFYGDTPFDDIRFLRAMVEDIAARLPVDRSRIYACGQSSGGMMCSELAWYASDLFVAVACFSGLWIERERRNHYPESVQPVPLLFLYGDRDWLVSAPEPAEGYPFPLQEEMRRRLDEWRAKYSLTGEPERYRNRPIDYCCYRDGQNIPMLTVGMVENMPHCNFPGESWIAWDEFFCRFRRLEDGSLEYQGKVIRPVPEQ